MKTLFLATLLAAAPAPAVSPSPEPPKPKIGLISREEIAACRAYAFNGTRYGCCFAPDGTYALWNEGSDGASGWQGLWDLKPDGKGGIALEVLENSYSTYLWDSEGPPCLSYGDPIGYSYPLRRGKDGALESPAGAFPRLGLRPPAKGGKP